MPSKFYRMTATAESQFWLALHESKQKWGHKRAEKYRQEFLVGLQSIADNYPRLETPHRASLAQGTDFSLHLVQHRYVAFQPYGKEAVIIAGIFHESMDIPAKLEALQTMSQQEIDTLKREIDGTRRPARPIHA